MTFTIEEDVKNRLKNVSKRLRLSQSRIVEEVLIELLPVLEEQSPNQMLKMALKKLSAGIDATASLFDEDMKKDESIENYKNSKR